MKREARGTPRQRLRCRARSWLPSLTLHGLASTALACSGGADISVLDPKADESASSEPASTPPEPASNPSCNALGRRSSALSVVDRSIVGSPAAYTPDRTLRAREGELVSSQRARRQVAWQIVQRVLAAMPLGTEVGAPPTAATLPAWQTWHAKDDLTRIFRRLYPELGPDDRAARARFGAAAIDAASRWNDGAVRDFEAWTAERLQAYRAAIDEAAEVAGLAGIYRVSYSPAASRHLLESYPEVLGCVESEPVESEPVESEPVESEPVESEPDAERDFDACANAGRPSPACLSGEFPDAAVLVKASWLRADLGARLPIFDTSAEGLQRRLAAPGEFSWGSADGEADPDEQDIYTLRLPSGNTFRLAGLHIMSKELDQWVWITLWWSPDASSDFGADRPSALPSPFDHYKLCSVVAFSENDPDPAGGMALEHPGLARALEATHAGVGGPTWCSNPYLEVGAGNAATNCIGCHQHAGTRLTPEDILGSAEEFPEFGRTELLRAFPADYVFAPTQGDDLGAMFEETEDHFLPTDP